MEGLQALLAKILFEIIAGFICVLNAGLNTLSAVLTFQYPVYYLSEKIDNSFK